MAKEIKALINIPEGVSVKLEGALLTVKGKAGEVRRDFFNPLVKIAQEGQKLRISAIRDTKRELKLVKTFAAHIRNMIKGAGEGCRYVLKICSGHFPMSVAVKGDQFEVKNFYGEKIPRILKIKKG